MPDTIFAVLGSLDYHRAFWQAGWSPKWYRGVDMLDEVDAVVFTGGADVSPNVYGDGIHSNTVIDQSERDALEVSVFHHCVNLGIPMVGICRGAQLLTALSGGRLYQHVDGHLGVHKVVSALGETFDVNSTHHQMMHPFTAPHYELLAWARGLSTRYETGNKLKLSPVKKEYTKGGGLYVVEPEVVWYPHTLSLAIQYHPERMSPEQQAFRFFKEVINEKVLA